LLTTSRTAQCGFLLEKIKDDTMPWLRAGTVAVTNTSQMVTGTNTDFVSNVRIGDAFIGPDGRSYEVSNVASPTVLAIIPVYQGPTVSGAAYSIMPVQGYQKDLADQVRGIVNAYGAKLATLGTTGNYDVLPISKGGTGGATLTDAKSNLGVLDVQTVARGGTGATDVAGARTALGAAKSGVNNDITQLTGVTVALSVAQGGTGGTSAAAARASLELGTAAITNVGTAVGNVMPVGAGGWLGPSLTSDGNANNAKTTGLYGLNNALNAPFTAIQLFTSDWGVDTRWQAQLALGVSQNKAYFRSILKDQSSATSWAEFYHTSNTTRGSGGALSAASPIVRIASVAASQRLDLQEQTFESVGDWGVANSEARGVTVERLGIGEYRIAGSLGLALEGWRTLDPCSPDGGRKLGITESEQSADGTVTIHLFKERWGLTEDGEMVPGKGARFDVPLNSWIDVRLEMPAPDLLAVTNKE
jgi:hypothetical protein